MLLVFRICGISILLAMQSNIGFIHIHDKVHHIQEKAHYQQVYML
jgi:hypothetical protein